MGVITRVAAMELRRIVGGHAKAAVMAFAFVAVALIWVVLVRPLSVRG